MNEFDDRHATRAAELVKKCVTQEMRPGVPLPSNEIDLVNAGLIDSMGWVGILTSIEEATEIQSFGNPWPNDRPQSIQSLVNIVLQSSAVRVGGTPLKGKLKREVEIVPVMIIGWGLTLGSITVDAATIESGCSLDAGTIRNRAGIESVRRADRGEDEVTLGQRAAKMALEVAGVDSERVDLLVVTSATYLSFPSLSATLHNRLLLREQCGALDVGGACVGVISALAAAKGMLSTSQREVALVVASEVNSRALSSSRVPGEFRGLFGDGACAFVLARSNSDSRKVGSRIGDFVFGCSGTFSTALQVKLHEAGMVEVQFKGEQLAKAAVTQLGRIVNELETLTGQHRSSVDYFALHEPNPRLVQLFAQNAGIPSDTVGHITKAYGNLGSATCGVSLSMALSRVHSSLNPARRPLIIAAAVGPGLLWGGTYLQ